MARRGRKPTGTNLVEHLDGSERAKTRLKAILETLSGARSIPEVCEDLGINESMFHRVRSEVLQTALERLEPRPLGRPPQAVAARRSCVWRNGRRELALANGVEGGRGPPRVGGEAAAVGQVGGSSGL